MGKQIHIQEKSMDSVYKDRILVLYIVPLMAVSATLIGTQHQWNEIFLEVLILKKIIYNLGTILLIWLGFRGVVAKLDVHLPWEKVKVVKRWAIQLSATICFSICLLLAITYLRSFVIPDWEFIPKVFLFTDIPIAVIFLLVSNFIYYHWYQVALSQKITAPLPTAKNEATRHLLIHKSKKTLQLDYSEIAYIYRQEKLNYLHTFSGSQHLLDYSLRQLENRLPNNKFYRINRQLIVHRSAIRSFKTLPNRQLQIELAEVEVEHNLLNKNRAADFKKWLENNVALK